MVWPDQAAICNVGQSSKIWSCFGCSKSIHTCWFRSQCSWLSLGHHERKLMLNVEHQMIKCHSNLKPETANSETLGSFLAPHFSQQLPPLVSKSRALMLLMPGSGQYCLMPTSCLTTRGREFCWLNPPTMGVPLVTSILLGLYVVSSIPTLVNTTDFFDGQILHVRKRYLRFGFNSQFRLKITSSEFGGFNRQNGG